MAVEIITRSAQETEALGKRLGQRLRGDEMIALFGGLGMGKTAFVRGLADMYRVESWDDLYSTGFFDYLGRGVVVTEWSENIEGALPEQRIDIEIAAPTHDDTRVFQISGIDLPQTSHTKAI